MIDFSTLSPLALILFGQSLESSDLLIVGLLVLLEGLLSIDNALVLGMLAKRLPKQLRPRALSYGLIGALVFRIVAILLSAVLLQWTFVKLIGGAYLIYISVRHLFFEKQESGTERMVRDESGGFRLVDGITGENIDSAREDLEIRQRVPVAANLVIERAKRAKKIMKAASLDPTEDEVCDVGSYHRSLFWRTVIVIELTDIAFAVDSILAAMALAGARSEKLWVVVVGGMLGVILMRFAAAMFVRLLEGFPRFEVSAYLLVIVIGFKLLADWAFNSDWSFGSSQWLGSWKTWWESVEAMRVRWIEGYEWWLDNRWFFGLVHGEEKSDAIKVARHLLNFHDLRRPECSGFWILMFGCFFYGFLPKRIHKKTTIA